MVGVKGIVARSMIRNALRVARVSPPWYNFTKNFWFRVYNGSAVLLKSHTHQEFVDLIRPVLVPNESLLDIKEQGWERSNNLFQFWLRNQHIEKKYGYTETYKNAEEYLSVNQDSLPTIATLKKLFNLTDWKYGNPEEKEELTKLPEKTILGTIDKETKSTKDLDFEDLLEIAGCYVKGRNEFNHFCEENRIYEFFTQDYVDRFAMYLKERSLYYSKLLNKKDITILEVGAGSGILCHFLKQTPSLKEYIIESKNENTPITINYIPTDSGRSRLHTNPKYDMIRISYSKAIAKYQPDIVICSWMPMDDDWSVHFRQFTSVQEYILIGEFYDGCCGHNWFTWGNPKAKPHPSHPRYAYIPAHYLRLVSNVEPYEKDNYEKTLLPNISNLQYSRYDSQHFRGNSATFSFRKKLK